MRMAIHIGRREFVATLGAAIAERSLSARAQPATNVPRIGILSPGRSETSDQTLNTLNGLLQGLRELGYTQGQNIAIERCFGEWNADRLRALAEELVGRKVDVICGAQYAGSACGQAGHQHNPHRRNSDG